MIGRAEVVISVNPRKTGGKNQMVLNINYKKKSIFGYHLKAQTSN